MTSSPATDSGRHTNDVSQNPSSDLVGNLLIDPLLDAHTIEVVPGVVLFEPETPAEHVFFIKTGQVRLYQLGPDSSTRLVDILGTGDWFGTGALAGQAGYGGRALVVSTSTIVQVRGDRFLAALGSQPTLAEHWISALAGKLQLARAEAACLMFDDCNSRLIRTLLRFSRTAAASPVREGGVVLRITHQQLAQAVGAARETVSLALTQLRQQNLLRTGRNQLFFDPQTLATFCRRPGTSESMANEQLA